MKVGMESSLLSYFSLRLVYNWLKEVYRKRLVHSCDWQI